MSLSRIPACLGMLLLYCYTPGISLSAIAQTVPWVEQGPTSLGGSNSNNGATRNVIVSSTNANLVYVSTINGGVWRTTNGTSASPNWTPLTDFMPSLSTSDMRFDPTDPSGQTLVASIGRFSSYSFVGGNLSGIYRTTDGGTSWSSINGSGSFMTGRNFHAIEPIAGNIIIASSNSSGTTGGIFRTANSGSTWTQVSGSGGLPASSPTYDVRSATFGAQTALYTVLSNTTAGQGGIYRSTDGGVNWTNVNNASQQTIFDANSIGNAKFAFGPNDGTTGQPTLFAVVSKNAYPGGNVLGLYRTTNPFDATPTWQSLDITRSGTNLIQNGQGNWHLSMAADPLNNNVVYVGGDVNYNRINASLASGSQASNFVNDTSPSSSPHVDFRGAAFQPMGGGNYSLIATSDGGIFRRTGTPGTGGAIPSGTGQWTSINNDIRSMEPTNVAYDPVSNTLTAGFQDNGTKTQGVGQTIATALTSQAWRSLGGGDGGMVAIDPFVTGSGTLNTTSTRYYSSQNLGGFTRQSFTNTNATSGGSTSLNPTVSNVAGTPALFTYDTGYIFINPVSTNRVIGGRLYIGSTTRVYESNDRGATVSDLSRNLPGGSVGVSINTIVAGGKSGGVDQPNVMYVSASNRIYGRGSSAAVLSDIQEITSYSSTVSQSVADISTDVREWHRLYVATSSINVWAGAVLEDLSGNLTATWTNRTGNLGSFGVGTLRAIEAVPVSGNANRNALVIGTSFGVFYQFSDDASSTWLSLGGGVFPNVLTFDLDYNAIDDVLVASTMGRGMWTMSNASIYFTSVPEPATYALMGSALSACCLVIWRRRRHRSAQLETQLTVATKM